MTPQGGPAGDGEGAHVHAGGSATEATPKEARVRTKFADVLFSLAAGNRINSV